MNTILALKFLLWIYRYLKRPQLFFFLKKVQLIERCLHDQLNNYFDKILSKYQYGFRKWFSIQQCLLLMIETLRKCLAKGEISAALLTYLSQVLIAKLHTYGDKEEF